MAVQQVRALLNGTWNVLTYNGTTLKYEKTLTAPSTTSFNLAGGVYPITIEATDDYGNVTTTTANLTVKEVTAPVITITSPTNGAKLSVNTPSMTFTLIDETNGSGIKLSTMTFKVDSTTYTSASAGMTCTPTTGGYTCTYVPQTALTDGSHTITINVGDNDGNNATQKTSTFTVDTVAPTLNVSSPTDLLKTNVTTFNVVGVTNDATSSIASVTVKVNGADSGTVTVDGSGNFTKSVTLVAGTNTIVIRSTDGAGKYTEITRTVYVNQVVPVISNVTVTPSTLTVGTSLAIACTVTDN